MRYQVVLMKSEEGYSVSCPALPGCASQGDTEEEALANIQDSIAEWKSVRADLNLPPVLEMREVEVAA